MYSLFWFNSVSFDCISVRAFEYTLPSTSLLDTAFFAYGSIIFCSLAPPKPLWYDCFATNSPIGEIVGSIVLNVFPALSVIGFVIEYSFEPGYFPFIPF